MNINSINITFALAIKPKKLTNANDINHTFIQYIDNDGSIYVTNNILWAAKYINELDILMADKAYIESELPDYEVQCLKLKK